MNYIELSTYSSHIIDRKICKVVYIHMYVNIRNIYFICTIYSRSVYYECMYIYVVSLDSQNNLMSQILCYHFKTEKKCSFEITQRSSHNLQISFKSCYYEGKKVIIRYFFPLSIWPKNNHWHWKWAPSSEYA